MRKSLILLGILTFIASSLFAQSNETLTVSGSKLIPLGKTKKLSELIDLPSSEIDKKAQFKKDKKAPNNFFNRPERNLARPDLEHQGPDPLRKLGRSSSSTAELEVNSNNDGIFSSPFFPLDPTGSIGIDYYLQAINATIIGVFNKDGSIHSSFSGNTLWSDLNLTSRGDPIIMFDQELSKWIITEFTRPASLLIAVSETSDPLGSYFAYEFVAPNFPDYPKYGIWNDHFVVTTNEQGPGSLHNYFIDRHALMSGAQDVSFQRAQVDGVSGFVIESPILITVPVDWEGQLKPSDNRPMILRLNDSSWGQSSVDGINIYQYDIDYDDPSNTTFELSFIETSPYDGHPCWGEAAFSCLPQMNGEPVAGIPETIMNTVQYRNFGTHESIVLAFITDVTDGNNLSGIRWMELRKDTPDKLWRLYQEGTYSPDDEVHRFMPSIAIDRLGCISIAYSVTSENHFVGLRMTGRCPDDPLGEMTVPEYSIVTGSSHLETEGNPDNPFGNRYGDYSHLSVDPTDELTMWFTSEYAGGNNRARTRIISYRLTRDEIDIAMNGLINKESGTGFTDSEVVEVSVANLGKTDIPSYEIGYLLNGVEQEKLTINQNIASKEEVTQSFSVPIDMTERGDYNITTFVNYFSDEVITNDTSHTTIIHYNDYDAVLELVPMFSDCGISRNFEVEITNQGAFPIENGIVEILFNGSVVDTLYTQNSFTQIPFLESRRIEFSLIEEVAEENVLEARFTNLETSEDANPMDNLARYQFQKDFLSLQVIFTIFTDMSPHENTYEVVDLETGEIVASGGPFMAEDVSIEEKFCLDPDKCYVFTMYDAGGDGLCCDNGIGIYRVDLFEEGVIFNGNTFFTSEDVHSFCPGNRDCSLNAEFNLGVDGSGLGSILITANDGIGPYTYSIDGGVTFQEENLFTDLPLGDYQVVVLDSDNECSYTETVTIEFQTNIKDQLQDQAQITVRPNPTEGFFNVDISGYLGAENYMTFQIIDANGRVIQERKISKFDEIFTTQISLLSYPDGIYFLRILNKDLNQLTKIIKQ